MYKIPRLCYFSVPTTPTPSPTTTPTTTPLPTTTPVPVYCQNCPDVFNKSCQSNSHTRCATDEACAFHRYSSGRVETKCQLVNSYFLKFLTFFTTNIKSNTHTNKSN